MPRRPSPSSQHRTQRVVFRLKPHQHARLAFKAASLNKTVNAYARLLAICDATNPHQRQGYALDPALIVELNRIGNNLNQITKRMHMTGRLSPAIPALCHRIETLIDEAIAKEIN